MSANSPPQGARQPQVQVRNLFPTPVALFELPEGRRISAELERTILAREAAAEGVRHSNLGGWQSPADFPDWCGPAGHAVIEAARTIAARMTCDRQGRPAETGWRFNAWANVNRHGQANEFHTHPGAFWSAVFWVSDGGAAGNPALGGEFEIADPRGVAPAMLAPELTLATQGGLSAGASELLAPRAGTLILFPSWLSHAVRPYRGNALRISVAINFTPAPSL